MHLNDDPASLYDVLELTPDATPQEIRSAYLRLKSSYGKDNIAHYTLFSREETEQVLQKIEMAYVTLSNPERRRTYDQGEGHHLPQGASLSNGEAAHSLRFDQQLPASASSTSSIMSSSLAYETFPEPVPTTTAYGMSGITSTATPSVNDVDSLIQGENEWSGPALRRIREARRMSLDDLADYTRISRAYLNALEEEDYQRLPAMVYVRGFLQQVSKRLKLPVETVVIRYLDRFKSARPDKA